MDGALDNQKNLLGFGGRIEDVARRVGGKTALAEVTGISPSQLYRYISETSSPTLEPLSAIARAGQVSLDWLITGAPAPGRPAADGAGDEAVRVPKVDQAFFQAAPGERDRHVLRILTLDREWVRAKGDPEDLVVVEMSGHNMYPTLINGDVVMINRSRTHPQPGKIYAFSLENSMIIRRLDVMPGKYVLHSDDPRHSSLEISVESFDRIAILGQVVFVFREVR